MRLAITFVLYVLYVLTLTTIQSAFSFSLSSSSNQNVMLACPSPKEVSSATSILQNYDKKQVEYMRLNPAGMGGGTSALRFLQSEISSQDRQEMRNAIKVLTNAAHYQRSLNSSQGRIMLGICAENVPEALMGLKTWVSSLALPKGLLHGMDIDGQPVNPDELGSVYIKYNTGGCMTFTQMRKSRMGFDALWKPGDAVLEQYDGDFRGIYFNVELNDDQFRQFGVLPTDLFLEQEEW